MAAAPAPNAVTAAIGSVPALVGAESVVGHETKVTAAKKPSKASESQLGPQIVLLAAGVAVTGVGISVKKAEHICYSSCLEALKAEMTFLEHELDCLEVTYGPAATHEPEADLWSSMTEDDLQTLTEEDLDDLERQTDKEFYE